MNGLPKHAFARHGVVVLAALSTALFVLVVAHLPVAILAGGGHDDAWFWQRAESIVAGDWLGEYSQFTLMKGAGYPLFLGFNHVVGTPIQVMQALLYSAGCGLMGVCVARLSARRWLGMAVFVLLQWHPMAMSWDRVIRDNIYAAQTLLVIGTLSWALFVSSSRRAQTGWAAASGLLLGWMWLTREDGIWIAPGVVFLFAMRAWQLRSDGRLLRRLAAVGVVLAACFAGMLALIAAINGIKYDAWETVDLKGKAYKRAITALQEVRVGAPVPYAPVPEKVRRAIYPHSPTFARLAPYLEGAGQHWHAPGCSIQPGTCGDYAGGWFLWALRDGVAALGEYGSAPQADAFYTRIADEVESACRQGQLNCVRNPVGFMPAVTGAQWKTVPAKVWNAISLLAWQDVAPPRLRSHARLTQAGGMWRFVGRPRVPDHPDELGDWVVGWFYTPDDAWIRLRCGPGATPVDIPRVPSPDIAAHFDDPDARERRFQFRLPTEPGCMLEANTAANPATLALADVAAGTKHFAFAGGDLHFDSVDGGIHPAAVAPAWAGSVRHWIGGIYAIVLPCLLGLGVLAYAGAVLLGVRRKRLTPLLVLALTGWGLVVSRMLVLVLVDISSFPAVNVQYMQPAFPLAVLAALLSCAALARAPGEPGSQRGAAAD